MSSPITDQVRLLCEKDREMMQEFSRRSLQALPSGSLLSLSLFSSYSKGNVQKEIDKDCLVIREAADAFQAGRPACDLDLEEIFEKTKQIDRNFIEQIMIPSFSFSIHYSDFADIRIQRIWRIALTVYVLLKKWPEKGSFAEVVTKAYTAREFKKIVNEVLKLYTMETRMLGNSIRSPFKKALLKYSEAMYRAMESVREDLAENYTQILFGDRKIHAEN